jgi:starch phosphorylase
VRQYTEAYYIPAAQRFLSRAANKGEKGIQAINWKNAFEKKWGKLRFGKITLTQGEAAYSFTVQVYLFDLDPQEIQVQMYARELEGGAPEKHEMMPGERIGGEGVCTYSVTIKTERPYTDYTARIIPQTTQLSLPLEFGGILWQR